MDAEALKLLNLSPIPELSEIELSTMLEQLSALSDQNSDITDRNIEEIIKEAEDLIDQSAFEKTSAKTITDKFLNNLDTANEAEARKEHITKKNEHCGTSHQSETSSERTSLNYTNDYDVPALQNCVSPQPESHSLTSPGSSTNLIKSTIDSLREYSSAMEKQISEKQSSDISENKNTISLNSKADLQEIHCHNFLSKANKKICDTEEVDNIKIDKLAPLQFPLKTYSTEKSEKKISCFERLYKSRPARLSGNFKNLKSQTEKFTKYSTRKRNTKNVKVSENISKCFSVSDKYTSNITEDKGEKQRNRIKSPQKWNSLDKKVNEKFDLKDTSVEAEVVPDINLSPLQKEQIENVLKDDLEPYLTHQNRQLKPEEKLMLRLLEELKEIKHKIQPMGVCLSDRGIPERFEDSHNEATTLESEGVNRLQEQFFLLKSKYDQQIEKLEMENEKLKEALKSKIAEGMQYPHNICTSECTKVPYNDVESENSNEKISLRRSISLGNIKVCGKSSPPNADAVETAGSTVREAFSQTETENQKNVSIQCEKVDETKREENVETEVGSTSNEKKAAENKENLLKKKMSKFRPFTDANSNQASKQKKIYSEHETQLMMALRSLRAESLIKEKETRKLKTEIELLKNQLKRSVPKKSDGIKRCHAGAQTIGLGPVNQGRPYDPRQFEAGSYDLERENEELKEQIIALEDSLEALKEKRINDLQSLHQVHEKEMAKLVSKLESQSALTKYLHSLLIKR